MKGVFEVFHSVVQSVTLMGFAYLSFERWPKETPVVFGVVILIYLGFFLWELISGPFREGFLEGRNGGR